MPAPRRFQHAFGRSAQTKILDHLWNHRNDGVNIRELSIAIRHSYIYTVGIVEGLEKRGLITRTRRGNESILRPNAKNPIVREVGRLRP